MAGTKSKFVRNVLNFYDQGLNNAFPSGVWADCPLQAIATDPSVGFVFFEDFAGPMQGDATATTNLDGWVVTQATAGAVDLSITAPGGVLEIDSASTTATQGINLQAIETTSFIPAADKDIWFEARWKIVDTYNKCELFVGLSAADTTIIAGSDMTAADHVGFECHTDDGVVLFGAEKAGTEATPLTSNTIAEDTYVRTGFKINGVTDIEHWVDGTKASTTHLTANIPIVAMCASFVCQSGGTNDPIMHLDYVKCVQLR